MNQQDMIDAIDRYFSDGSRHASLTLSGLSAAQEHIGVLMEAIRSDLDDVED